MAIIIFVAHVFGANQKTFIDASVATADDSHLPLYCQPPAKVRWTSTSMGILLSLWHMSFGVIQRTIKDFHVVLTIFVAHVNGEHPG